MAFTNDEQFLNGINLDSIDEYQQFVKQLQPILLKEAGYETTSDTKNPFNDFDTAYESIFTNGRQAGLSDTQIGKKLGLSATQVNEAASFLEKTNKAVAYYENEHDQGKLTDEQYGRKMARIQDETSKFSVTNLGLKKTADRQALEDRYKALQDQQLSISEAQADRQKKALNGDIPTSPILAGQIQKEFDTFKENQARAGNVILGDNIDSAVGKGSAAIESLKAFKDNSDAAKQREIQSIVQGETPLFYAGLGLAGQRGGVSLPTASDYSGATQLGLAGQQPFQSYRNWDLQRFMAENASRSSKSSGNMSGLIGAGLGAGIGGLLAAPTGGMSIPMGMMIGSQFGGGAGTLFGGGQ